jgi:hypothetical protein
MQHGEVNKYDLIVFIKLFQGSEKMCSFFRVTVVFQFPQMDSTDEPQTRFPVQNHILSIAEDALR